MPWWCGSPASAHPRSLNRKGTPRNGPSGKRRAGFPSGSLELAMDHTVQLGVELLDALDGGVDEVERMDDAVPDQLGQGGRVVVGEHVSHLSAELDRR